MSAAVVVADVGGTTLRIGRMEHGALHAVHRAPTEGLALYPRATADDLQRRVLAQLTVELDAYLRSPAGAGAGAVGLSFAGPITSDGRVIAAPPSWGKGGDPVALGSRLTSDLGLPVHTVNDLTAAVWRYATPECDSFCLITVSSGIGTKVFRHGEVLVDDAGFGGELGHWRVDPSADAVPCDCGGVGHLGAIASGRGVLLAARRAAVERPDDFLASTLGAGELHPAQLSNERLAAAIRMGDRFAVDVLRAALSPLAMAIGGVFASIGIRTFIVIGGFAVAVGDHFVKTLGDHLVEWGCFGLTPDQVRDMLVLGAADDDHSLIGLGRMLTGRGPAPGRQVNPACAS